MSKKKKWEMPDWMRPYETYFNNTGGNSVEDLMNRNANEANIFINAPLALICTAVEAQVRLLMALKMANKIPELLGGKKP